MCPVSLVNNVAASPRANRILDAAAIIGPAEPAAMDGDPAPQREAIAVVENIPRRT